MIYGGDAPGPLTVNGNYTMTNSSAYDENISNTTNSELVTLGNGSTSGIDTLTGALDISLLNGFIPSVGQMFVIMTFNNELGQFSTETVNGANGLTFNGGTEAFTVVYDQHDVTLKVVAAGGGGGGAEPTSLMLLGGGLATLAWRSRLRNGAPDPAVDGQG